MNADKGLGEFSYEDSGQFGLHQFMFLVMAVLLGLMINTFMKFYREEKSLMAPHPIIVFALLFQVLSILLELIHLWSYSDNGYGIVVADFFESFPWHI
jgi:hypothetical protein